MMPQQRPDPKVIQKTIEIVTSRKRALSRLIESIERFQEALTIVPEAHETGGVVSVCLIGPACDVCQAYTDLQKLELAGAEAYLNDLEAALKQAESPILQAHMQPRGRG